jgi:hypothetical protein
VTCMQKGAPILRSALIGWLQLELTYRDPSAHQWTDELQTDDQAKHDAELSTAADFDTPGSLQLTAHALASRV